ncbi:MAG: hypothetical protein VR70_02155 [Rhodospirillaceae bacterium BRH_c57]|nr:MAG: hypothetical protein VR70_02155 [Rhodospirillaceae bacterium BRH_c57]
MTLNALHAFDIDNASVTLWCFKKNQKPGENPKLKGTWVDTSDELCSVLKSVVNTAREAIKETLPYSLLAQNNESSALSITTLETHGGLVVEQATDEIAEKKVGSVKDINNTEFYSIKLVHNGVALHAIRKTDDSWKTKKTKWSIPVVYSPTQELDIDDTVGFTISRSVDFFILGDSILVSNKLRFESLLNYKEAHRDDFRLLNQEPEFSRVFADMAPLIAYVGDNKIQLRRASAIKMKGHYKNPGFMANLQAHHANLGLNIKFDTNAKIIPCAETCRDIFQALLDHRLDSRLSNQLYDVENATDVKG